MGVTAAHWRWVALALSALAVASGLFGIFTRHKLAGDIGVAAMWVGFIATELYRRRVFEGR